jgi:uncharacterized protein (DUF2141 family)
MVRILTLLIMYFVSQFIFSQAEEADLEQVINNTPDQFNISVTIPNVTSDKGTVRFALYDRLSFMQQPLAAKISKINNGTATALFDHIVSGEYVVLCFHDSNENNKMDFDESGIPIEDYGASNNIFQMGPPVFDDTKFIVDNKSVDLTIKF